VTAFSGEIAAIHAAFAEPVAYTGAGLGGATIAAIKSDEAGDPFQGPGSTVRKISFEVLQAALPGTPAKGNIIVHAGTSWRVIDITRRDDVAAWALIVERAA
jgi:hypothetical protein